MSCVCIFQVSEQDQQAQPIVPEVARRAQLEAGLGQGHQGQGHPEVGRDHPEVGRDHQEAGQGRPGVGRDHQHTVVDQPVPPGVGLQQEVSEVDLEAQLAVTAAEAGLFKHTQ